jgi:glycosyltransferase involved in cell wall biosynthesis
MKLKALFVPYFRKVPYQDELAGALRAVDVDVRFGSGYIPFGAVFFSVLRNGVPDVLHLHWLTFFYASARVPAAVVFEIVNFAFEMSFLLMLKAAGVRICWTAHNEITHGARFKAVELAASRAVAALSSAIIVHSEDARRVIAKLYRTDASKIRVIPQGNYIGYYKNDVSRADARKKLGLRENGKVFLFFGMIKTYKALPALLEAFGRGSLPGATLLVVGKPQDEAVKKETERTAAGLDNVKLVLEYVPDDDVQIYMNAADAVIMSYDKVLTSAALLAAMSFGKAVIAPEFGYFREIAGEKGCVFFEPARAGSIKEALERAMKLDLEAMGRHNLERAGEYGWDSAARLTKEVYLGK